MNNEFIKAVEENKVNIVRMMLSNELLIDPRGKTFSEMLEYAKDKMPDLFEPNEPARFDIPTNKEEWTDDIVSKMKRDLNMNFSIEKLSLFAEMAIWVGRGKAEQLDNKEQTKRASGGKRHEDANKHDDNVTHATTAPTTNKRPDAHRTASFVTAGGALLTIVGICAGKTLITIIGGIVVVGGVVLMTCKGDRKYEK